MAPVTSAVPLETVSGWATASESFPPGDASPSTTASATLLAIDAATNPAAASALRTELFIYVPPFHANYTTGSDPRYAGESSRRLWITARRASYFTRLG